MGCGQSRDIKDENINNYRYYGTEIPIWKQENHSLLKKCLTQQLWDKLKDEQDSFGCTLGHIINSGVENEDSVIGVYAGSPDTYTVFAPLMDKIVQGYHGFKPKIDKQFSGDWDAEKLAFPEPLDDKYCVSTRIRIVRNLENFPFSTYITPEQRRQVEQIARKAFSTLSGQFAGMYHSLHVQSDVVRKKLIKDLLKLKKYDQFSESHGQLIADLLSLKKNEFSESAGINRQWPNSRGIYHNEAKTFLCQVNEEDQFKIISMQEGGDIKEVFEILAGAYMALKMGNTGLNFSYSFHLGYLSTCPTNIGTGLRASIYVKLPKLSKENQLFKQIAANNNVIVKKVVRENSESDIDVYDVSNKRRIGLTEVQLILDVYNGVKAMIKAEKSLPDPPDQYRYTGAEIPQWQPTNKSLLREHLTQQVWMALQDKKDSFGCTLGDIINSGVKNEDSVIGVYAGSPETYTVFAPLMYKIIESFHGFKPNDNHSSDWDVSKLSFPEPLDDNYCIITRISLARNLEGYPFCTFITSEQRKQVEEHAIKAFVSMQGDLKGEYYYPLGDLSSANKKQLIADDFLFKEGNRFSETCGLNRQWPESRGIYHNDDKTFLCWVNQEDQFRIISMQNGGDIKACFERLANGQAAIEGEAKFSFSNHFGYLTTCPTNIGTGLRASILVKLPKISKQKERFERIASDFYVSATEYDTGVYEISNKLSIGYTEVQVIWQIYYGVKALIKAEVSIPDPEDLFRYTGKEIPVWLDSNKSLLKQNLTLDVWEALKDKQDSYGCTLSHIINPGIKDNQSVIGVYAGGPDTYTVFAPLFNKIIEQYHGFKPTDNHISDWDVSKLTFPEPLDDKHCLFTGMRIARNFEDYPFAFITPEQRKQVEEHAKEVFASFQGELKGTYYPLGGLSSDDKRLFKDDHILFREGDPFMEASGLNRQWPDSRGIFYNDDKTFLCWVNEEDQFKINSMQEGGDIKAVFTRLAYAQKALERAHEFSFCPHLGYLTTCLTNIGTGLRASIHVILPKISKQKERFQRILFQNNLQVLGVCEEYSEFHKEIFDISNKQVIGLTEVQLAWNLYNGVKALIEVEQSIADLHAYTGNVNPNWKPQIKPLLDKCQNSWKTIQKKMDSFGCTLGNIINWYSGMKIEQQILSEFAYLFDKIIESYKTTYSHDRTQDVDQIIFTEPLDDQYCVSTRIRVAKNLEGLPFSTFITFEQKKLLEYNVIKASDPNGDLMNKQQSLGDLSNAQKKQLNIDPFLFKEGDRFHTFGDLLSSAVQSTQINPGIMFGQKSNVSLGNKKSLIADPFLFKEGDRFHNDDKTFMCCANEEDQYKVIYMQEGGDIKAVFIILADFQCTIENVARYSLSSHIGYLSTCPSKVGTGLRASILVKLPKLSKEKERFEKITSENNVQGR